MSALAVINEALAELEELPAVAGVIFTDRHGDVVELRMPSFYETEQLRAVAGEVVRIAANLRVNKRRFPDQNWHFGDLRIMASDLNRGFLILLLEEGACSPLLELKIRALRRRVAGALAFPQRFNQTTSLSAS